MVFSSITFIYYFLPIVLLIYFIVPKKVKNIVLLISSIIFYIYGDISYLVVLLSSCLINYLSALLISHFKNIKKLILILTIIIDLGILVYFKYANFLIDNINLVLKTSFSLYDIVLPLGISFFTFQTLSYVVDVYKGEVEANKNFFSFATYVTMFPQLIAGPIVRYKDINKELKKRELSLDLFGEGVKRFIIGLGKKVLIANEMGTMINHLYGLKEMSVLAYILIAFGYAIQLYFDFSGYSDMAIGLGKMFGFNFLENFNYPFIASSITDFWRRWHISLSSFFRDYVYIPLGGNRKGKIRQYFNLLVVWFLTGLWHGANYNFILWGLFFLVILVLEKTFLQKFLNKFKITAHLYTIFIIVISFTIFSITDIKELGLFFKSMFGFNHLKFINHDTIYYFRSYLSLIIASSILSTPLIKNIFSKKIKVLEILEVLLLLIILILVTVSLLDSTFNPFLYFRF